MSLKLDKIQMIEASCLSFSVQNNPPFKEVKGFSFDYSAQTKADAANKLILIQLRIDISAKAEEGQDIYKAGQFEFGFTYRVDNLEELIEIVDDHSALDQTLHMSVLGIAFSTARGIIITKAADTILQAAYLPIVNPANLLDANVEI